jgi:hypothetical protein
VGKIVDFDKYIKERRRVSPKFTLFGETYTLPPSMPYNAMLYIQSLSNEEASARINNDDLLYFFKLLFAEHVDAIENWKNHPDFDMDLISSMTSWVLEAYNESDPKGTVTLEESQAL